MHISVITPVYNAARFVEKAVNSVLQFDIVKEILLIEDGSDDNSLKICVSLEKEHSRVKLFQHPDKKNHGAGASRNLGLENATCSYIAFLDADDYFLPNRFDADKKVFEDNLQADGVYNAIGAHFYSEESKTNFSLAFHFSKKNLTTIKKSLMPNELFPCLISYRVGYGHFHLDGLTFKKEVLKKMNAWFDPELKLHQDTDFIIRMSYYASLFGGELLKPVAIRGVHDDNRILKAKRDPRIINSSRYKQWKNIYLWAKKEKIPCNYLNHLFCIKSVSEIKTSKYLKAWLLFFQNVIIDKNILLKCNYYDSLHYHFFGKNRFSKFLLKAKYKIQKVMGISWNI